MKSFLLQKVPPRLSSLAVEGVHKPGSLTSASGAWIHAAGSFVLEKGVHNLNPHEQWVWLAVERGDIVLSWDNHELALSAESTCFLPGGDKPCHIATEKETRCLWIALEGPLSPMVVRKMGALLHMPLKQGALPSQIYLAEQIVQVIVRHTGTADATYQLQHLLYGMIATHWGQPVAMDAMLSHEIAKVVDTLRANQYKDNYSLAEMAAISRMPMETFRKRFVAEVGMPPADGDLPQALCGGGGHAAPFLRAALQDGAGQGAAPRPGLFRPPGGDRGGHAGSLPFLQAVQAHRGDQPERLHEAGLHAVRDDPRRLPQIRKEITIRNYTVFRFARSRSSSRAAGFSMA